MVAKASFTPQQLLDTMIDLAKASPDFRYHGGDKNFDEDPYAYNKTCRYLTDEDKTKGSCIVGQALVKLGYPAEDIAQFESQSSTKVCQRIFDLPGDEVDYSEYSNVVARIRRMQTTQDNNETWGEALEKVLVAA